MINQAALDYMKERALPEIVIDQFAAYVDTVFSSRQEWERCLDALGLTGMKVTPDPVQIASEAALWGAIRHQGLLQGPLGETVVVSDDAGQFRVGAHAPCWVHAERLVHKLIPANDRQRNAVETAKRMIWWFYQALKDYKLAPSLEPAETPRARFDRIFRRLRTGYATLDSCSGDCSATRPASCASWSAPKSRSLPTPAKTISGPSSPNEKSPEEPSAKTDATAAISCSAWPTPAGN